MKKIMTMLLLAGFAGAARAGDVAELQAARAGDLAGREAAPVSAPEADRSALESEYGEYYSALKAYSETAFRTPQESELFRESAAAGQYLRARLDGMEELMGRFNWLPGRLDLLPARVSFRVLSELQDVFGGPSAAGADSRGVVIKPGYCQINYVKKTTPFLVQQDGFLAKGEVIMTFDDGPGPLTDEVSGSMKAGGAPSLFFVLGSRLGAEGKARLKRSVEAGHSPGVHGYWHATQSGKPFTAYSTGEILKQLGGVKASIAGAAGAEPRFFRPPYGVISPEAVKVLDARLGLVPVGWTIDTMDWSTKDPDVLFSKSVQMLKQRGKGIVLMHDIHPQSRTASARLVKWLAANGFRVVPPSRLEKAYRGK